MTKTSIPHTGLSMQDHWTTFRFYQQAVICKHSEAPLVSPNTPPLDYRYPHATLVGVFTATKHFRHKFYGICNVLPAMLKYAIELCNAHHHSWQLMQQASIQGFTQDVAVLKSGDSLFCVIHRAIALQSITGKVHTTILKTTCQLT